MPPRKILAKPNPNGGRRPSFSREWWNLCARSLPLAMHRGDQPLLEETGGKLMMLEPRSPEGYILHGQALLMKKDQAGAEADLKRAINVAPDNAAGYARMGDLRAVQKKYDEAQKYYSEALQRNPSAVDALTGLVNIAMNRNSRRLRCASCRTRLRRCPTTAASTSCLAKSSFVIRIPPKPSRPSRKLWISTRTTSTRS